MLVALRARVRWRLGDEKSGIIKVITFHPVANMNVQDYGNVFSACQDFSQTKVADWPTDSTGTFMVQYIDYINYVKYSMALMVL